MSRGDIKVDEITFRLVGEMPGIQQALSKWALDGKVARACLDGFLRGVIEHRLEDIGWDALLTKELDRRIEAAVARVVPTLERRCHEAAEQLMSEKVARVIRERYDIQVSVQLVERVAR